MSKPISSSPRQQPQFETDPETSSLISSPSVSEKSSASEDGSEKSAQAPVMKTRPTVAKSPINSSTDTAGSSAPPEVTMTSSLPTVVNKPAAEEKRVRHHQARHLPAHQHDMNTNNIKTEKQRGEADIRQTPNPDNRWNQFTKALTEDGQLELDLYDENEISDLIAWLDTSPLSLRELVIRGLIFHLRDTHAIALADALKINRTLTKLDLVKNNIGDEGAKALADTLQFNNTVNELSLGRNLIGDEGAIALINPLQANTTLTKLDLSSNYVGEEFAKALANALKVNATVTELDLSDNVIGEEGAKALADALKINTSVTKLRLRGALIGEEGAKALVEALHVNTTLTQLLFDDDDEIDAEKNNLLERNRRLKLQPLAEASLDLLVRHSPLLKYMGVPTDVLPVLAEQLSNEVLSVFEQEWQEVFRAPVPPITTTTTNTTTTTTTTTTDATIPAILTSSPTAPATSPASATPPITGPTVTAADIKALLADPSPVVALSRWIDGQTNPVAALNWVDPANGYTLLHHAVAEQQGAVVRSLLARGIDRTKADYNNQTAAQLAHARADSSSSGVAAAIAALLR